MRALANKRPPENTTKKKTTTNFQLRRDSDYSFVCAKNNFNANFLSFVHWVWSVCYGLTLLLYRRAGKMDYNEARYRSDKTKRLRRFSNDFFYVSSHAASATSARTYSTASHREQNTFSNTKML